MLSSYCPIRCSAVLSPCNLPLQPLSPHGQIDAPSVLLFERREVSAEYLHATLVSASKSLSLC